MPNVELEEKHAREREFHDSKYSETGKGLYPPHYKLNPTYAVYKAMLAEIGDLRDKRVLELGCGEGWITRDLAVAGARVSAFDISEQAVENTRRVLSMAGLERGCDLRVMAAEKLDYPDGEFDVVVGFAIIHHLNVCKALAEVARVLKPVGFAVFAEPLGTNPIVNFYRRLTPQYRTADERPLVLTEFSKLLGEFRRFSHREHYLFAMTGLVLAYVPGGRIVFPAVNRALLAIDRLVMRLAPRLSSWAWYSIIRLEK
jgi:2-polyprenyl-3-methyl-5-hydroxy-6-metoxy-1,4-benzoquinol methylase